MVGRYGPAAAGDFGEVTLGNAKMGVVATEDIGSTHPVPVKPEILVARIGEQNFRDMVEQGAQSGGIFVEPSEGHARIVQGRVIATDTRSNMVLADVVVPMWIAVPQGQAASDFATGDLLNFYVQSGSTIEPVR